MHGGRSPVKPTSSGNSVVAASSPRGGPVGARSKPDARGSGSPCASIRHTYNALRPHQALDERTPRGLPD